MTRPPSTIETWPVRRGRRGRDLHPGRRRPADQGRREGGHHATKAELEAAGVELSTDVNVVDEGPLAGWRSVHFPDPDGLAVELAEVAYHTRDERESNAAAYLASRRPRAEIEASVEPSGQRRRATRSTGREGILRRMEAGRTGDPRTSEADALGARLRAIRLARGISVRELARRLDVSPSAISQIETGKIQPSVRTLYALAAEFGVSMNEALFDEPPAPRPEAPAAEATVIVASGGPGLSVQRADGRKAITLESGVRWERLMVWADDDVEFLQATYEPGGASSADDRLVRHNGHEFGLVLSGSLRVHVGFDEFLLGPGDSITFPSSTPHRLSNDGDETVHAVWVVRGRRGDARPGA